MTFKVGDRVRVTSHRYGPGQFGKTGIVDGLKKNQYRSEHLELITHTSPVRTETVTTRRIEPGVYGPLRIWGEIDIPDCERPDETPVREVEVSFAATNIDENGIELRSLNASEWRELARVALEIAEYLDAQ